MQPLKKVSLQRGHPVCAQWRGYPLCKRLMDIALSALALVVLAPVFVLIAACVRLESKGRVIYAHIRVGKQGRPFTMYKFRSMAQGAEELKPELREHNRRKGPAFKAKDDPRVTRVGAFLRKTCLDELPQLLNVLKGEMSLVGPRPPLPEEVEQYLPRHLLRLEALPGLTCFWQVSNREMTFDQWVESDLAYLQNAGLLLDAKLILQTVTFLFSGKGDS